MTPSTDTELVSSAAAGDRDALTELYDRYFGAVYDFVIRVLRNREDAEDVTQDTFVKVLGSLSALERPEAFKSWLFSVAHNAAVSHVRRRTRQTSPVEAGAVAEAVDDSSIRFDVPDSDRLAQPATALDLAASAALVWEAASGLEERQYEVLDLNVRRGLESPEIAEVLGVTRNHAAVLLTRAKSALKTNVTALVLLHEGRRSCPGLDAELAGAGILSLSRTTVATVTSHARDCSQCQSTQSRLASPEAILAGLAPVAAVGSFKTAILGSLIGGAGVAAGAAAGAAGGTAAGGAAGGAGAGGGVLVPAGIAAGVVAAAVAVAGTLFALGIFDSSEQPAAPTETPAPPLATATPTPSPTPLPPTPTPTAVPPTPTPTPSPTPPPRAAIPTPVPLPERMIASALSMNAPVVQKGLIDGGYRMDSPDGPDDIAWYVFTAKPGTPGNAVFSGHYDFLGRGPAVFYDLNNLQPGDELTIQLAGGPLLYYTVTSSTVYDQWLMPMGEILALGSTDETITLITCAGSFIGGDYSHRLVVVASRTG